MKQTILILYLFLTSITSNGQISVNSKNLKNAHFRHFDEVETVFVLPEIYNKATYDSILEASWHITPYEVVSLKNFKLNNYLGRQYIFAELKVFKTGMIKKNKNSQKKINIHSIVEFYTYNYNRLNKSLKSIYKKKSSNKGKLITDTYLSNKITIAQFLLFPTGELWSLIIKNDTKTVKEFLSHKESFFNYKPGFLKNYFQKINNLLTEKKNYWMRNKEYLPEVKKLTQQTLYIPDFVARKFDPLKGIYSEPDTLIVNHAFWNYKYDYQLIKPDKLSEKIMQNEPVYYLMFVRLNRDRFLQIVNARTGEIVFRSYEPVSNNFNLEPLFIDELNKVIEMAIRK